MAAPSASTPTAPMISAAETLDFAGTLVPAYTLNSVLGNIPVLGNLLPAARARASSPPISASPAPIADPKVTVNPLSALAPGVLRKLFLFDAPEPAPPPRWAARGSARQTPAARPGRPLCGRPHRVRSRSNRTGCLSAAA